MKSNKLSVNHDEINTVNCKRIDADSEFQNSSEKSENNFIK